MTPFASPHIVPPNRDSQQGTVFEMSNFYSQRVPHRLRVETVALLPEITNTRTPMGAQLKVGGIRLAKLMPLPMNQSQRQAPAPTGATTSTIADDKLPVVPEVHKGL